MDPRSRGTWRSRCTCKTIPPNQMPLWTQCSLSVIKFLKGCEKSKEGWDGAAQGVLTVWWHQIKAADYFCGLFKDSLVFSKTMCACKRCIICVISGWMHLIISKNHFTNRCLLLLFLVLIILCSCKLFFFQSPCVPFPFFVKDFSSRAIFPLKIRMWSGTIKDTIKLWKCSLVHILI